MKRAALFTIALLVCFSCVSKKSADRVEAERDSLASEVAVKDSLLDDVFTSLNTISENLYAITVREDIVATNASGEISTEQKQRINDDIAAIDLLLQENRTTIQRLKSSTEQLRRANVRIGELQSLVENLNEQLARKDADLEELRNKLVVLDIEVEELTRQVNILNLDKADLASTVTAQTGALNQVHYIVGNEKELIAANVLYKSGFLGRTLKVESDYDLVLFTAADKTSFDELLVGHKKITLVTTHPAGSYELVEDADGVVESIRITDKAKFWESSKIMVVSYKR